MSRLSFSYKFFTKPHNSDKDKCSLYVRITVNRKSSEISLKRNFLEKSWDSIKGKMKGGSELAMSINHYITSNESKLIKIHSKLVDEDKDYTAKLIKDIFLGKDKTKHLLLESFEKHNEQIKALAESGNQYSYDTYTRYKTTREHVKDYIESMGEIDIQLKDIDSEWIHGLDYYLKTNKGIGNNTTIKYIKNLKKIFRIGLTNGWVFKDPFLHYKPKLDPVKRDFLSLEDVKKLSDKNLHVDRLEQVRDIFLFCCYTGLRYSDVKLITPSDIHIEINGSKSILIQTKKTSSTVRIPIFPKAEEILKKYSDHILCLRNETCLPVLSNQKTNAYLKEIAILAEVDKNLTFHMARHTFATLALEHGVSMGTVKAILGHSDIVTTQVYAKVTDNKVMNEMAEFKEKINF